MLIDLTLDYFYFKRIRVIVIKELKMKRFLKVSTHTSKYLTETMHYLSNYRITLFENDKCVCFNVKGLGT